MARKSAKKKKKSQHLTPQDPSRQVGWWERLEEWQRHAVCGLLLLMVGLIFYGPLLFGEKELVGGDIVQWRSMAESMIEYREATGEEALWSTNAFSGMPGYLISLPKEIPHLDVISTFLRGFMWPLSHFILLLAGMYVLVFYLTRNHGAGVLAACAYGLTTYLSAIILVAGHNTKFITLCFAPWLVLAFIYTLRNPRLLSALFFAIALALNFRGEHIQITYYVAFACGIWWIVETIGAVRNGRIKAHAQATGWLVLGSVLAILMVAHPYLPISEYKAHSIRGASSGGAAGEGALAWEYAMGWSHEFGELVTLLIADAYGGSQLYWGPKIFTGGPHYVGGIVIVLALLALWRLRRNAVWALGISTGLMLLFSLGENLPLLNRPMFNYFPLFSSFRVPETWLSMVALTLALLAGYGLYFVTRKEASDQAEQEKTRALYIGWGGLLGLVALLLVAKGVFFNFERPQEFAQITQQIAAGNNVSPNDPRVAQAANQYLDEVGAEREDAFANDALRTLLFLLLGAGGLVAFRKEKIPAWALQGALVVLVAVDLGGVGHRYLIPALENQPAQQPDPEARITEYGFDRYINEQRAALGGKGHFRVLSLEGQPTQNGRPSYFHESIGGYHGAKLRRYQDYLDHVLFDARTGMPNETALDLLNVQYIIARGALPGTEVVFQDASTGFAVLENPDAVPRAFFVGEQEIVADNETMWERLRDPDFDPQAKVFLGSDIAFETTPIDSSSMVSVTLSSYSAREIVWQVQTDAPRLLVASEVYYPAGWQAFIDGESAEIVPANYLFRGVAIPAGQHEVVMRFAPRSYVLSKWIAGGTTGFVYGAVLLLLGMGWMRKRSQHNKQGEAGPAS